MTLVFSDIPDEQGGPGQLQGGVRAGHLFVKEPGAIRRPGLKLLKTTRL